MADKLWDKGFDLDNTIERFTIGNDQQIDLLLARYDVLASLAHAKMLAHVGLLTNNELASITNELKKIFTLCQTNQFVIEEGVEDVHSQIELMLTRQLADTGKKIHAGRSRNDQVLVDIKLFTRNAIRTVVGNIKTLFDTLLSRSNDSKNILMPGYTHLQVAMPSSFGLWFAAYAESLADDVLFLHAAYHMANRNPLGSAAGYGSSFPLSRQMTTELLGFENMDYNAIYAQMNRGKMERNIASSLASVAATLAKLATDACLFNSQNFGFINLPRECTTGSSIMPHKKNPDVLELIRAKCNSIQAIPQQITIMTNNLPSGYFRDYQLLKEVFLPSFNTLNECITMSNFIVEHITPRNNILDDTKYDAIFSVEEVNRLVTQGVPFRDAYKTVATEIENNSFVPNKHLHHTHEGSIGNLCNEQLATMMQQRINNFHFEQIDAAEKKLLA